MSYSLKEIASSLDATNLKLEATRSDIESLCQESLANRVASVCVYPNSVPICREILGPGEIGLAAVVGFPSGRYAVASKCLEIEEVAAAGATEIDAVLDYPALVDGQFNVVAAEASRLAESCRQAGALSKFIVETCYLDRQQKLDMLHICEDAGANFIKTSTGFGSAGAQLEDVQLWASERKSDELKIKASGGIRSRDQVVAFLEAGASRIGLSSAKAVLADGGEASSGAY